MKGRSLLPSMVALPKRPRLLPKLPQVPGRAQFTAIAGRMQGLIGASRRGRG